MKLLLWAVVLASPWETGWFPPARFLAVDRRFEDHGYGRLGTAEGGSPGGLGMAGSANRGTRSKHIWQMVALADHSTGSSPPNVDAPQQDLGLDQDPLAGFIEHRELRLRDERIAANVCVDDGEQDLCATSIPEIHRERCKCDYACGEYDDCCIDNRGVTSVDRKWTCYERGGFYVIRACPNSWPNDQVRHRCEEDPDKLNMTVSYLNQLPVLEQKSGFMFWNVFCAICNRKTDLIRPWGRSRLVCTNEGLFNRTDFEDRFRPGEHIVKFDAEVVEKLVELGNLTYNVNTEEFTLHNGKFQHDCILDIPEFRDIDFIKTNVLRKCIESITVCQKTFFSKEDQDLARKCTSYTSYVHDKITARNYKNYHCALCDGVKLWNIRCGAYSNTQNWNVFMVTRTAWPKTISVDLWPWYEDRQGEYVGKCAQNMLYDDLLHVCVYIGCPEQFVWVEEEAQCLNILDTLPDPYSNVNLTTSCITQRIPYDWVAELRHKEIKLNHTGKVLRPSEYYMTRSQNNTPDYIYYCEPDWLSFEFQSRDMLIFNALNYLSMIGLFCVIVLHVVVYELRSSQWGKTIQMLAVSSLCANITFACALYKQPFASDCYTTGLAMIFFHLAMYFWASSAILDSYRCLFNKLPKKRRGQGPSTKKFGMFSWGLALVFTVLSSTSDKWGAEFGIGARVGKPLCFVSTGIAFALFFYGPLILVGLADLLGVLLCLKRILCRPRPPVRIHVHGRTQGTEGVSYTNRNHFYTIAGFLILSFTTWTSVFLAVDMQIIEGWTVFSILYGCQGLWLTARTALNPTGFWLFVDEVTHRDPRHRAMRSAGVLVSSAKDLPALTMPEDRSHREPTPCPLTPKFSTELSRKNLFLQAPSAPGQSRRPSAIVQDFNHSPPPPMNPNPNNHRYGPPVTNLIPATPLPKHMDRPKFPHERRVSSAVIKPIHMNVPQSALTPILPPPTGPTPPGSATNTMSRQHQQHM